MKTEKDIKKQISNLNRYTKKTTHSREGKIALSTMIYTLKWVIK
jgi:hypothetical protein